MIDMHKDHLILRNLSYIIKVFSMPNSGQNVYNPKYCSTSMGLLNPISFFLVLLANPSLLCLPEQILHYKNGFKI